MLNLISPFAATLRHNERSNPSGRKTDPTDIKQEGSEQQQRPETDNTPRGKSFPEQSLFNRLREQ